MQARVIQRQGGIELPQTALKVQVGQIGRGAVAGSGHEHDIQVVREDQPVEVRVDEVDAGAGAPVAEEPVLDVFGPERFPQEHVVAQVNLGTSQVVNRTKVAGGESTSHDGISFLKSAAALKYLPLTTNRFLPKDQSTMSPDPLSSFIVSLPGPSNFPAISFFIAATRRSRKSSRGWHAAAKGRLLHLPFSAAMISC